MDINPNLPERFWKNIDKSGDCWKWKGAHSFGYAKYYHNGKYVMVQRIIADKLPINKKVCKTCHNVWCMNPAHMYYDPDGADFGPPQDGKISIEDIAAILHGGPTTHLGVPQSFIEKIRRYVRPPEKPLEPQTVDSVTR